jgi:hypothetical protein
VKSISSLIDGTEPRVSREIKEICVIEFTPLAFSSHRKLFKSKVKVFRCFSFASNLRVAEQIVLDP